MLKQSKGNMGDGVKYYPKFFSMKLLDKEVLSEIFLKPRGLIVVGQSNCPRHFKMVKNVSAL
jgi:hypothetical protein